MARRKIRPIPLEILWDDPRVISLPAAGRGMLINLVWHWWLTDCEPLPESGDRLFALSQAHRPTWHGYQSVIMSILTDRLPDIAKWVEDSRKRAEPLAKLRQLSVARNKLRTLEKQAQHSAVHPELVRPIISQANRAARVINAAPPVKKGGFSDPVR